MLRVPLVPLVAEVSVELVPLMVEPLVVPLVVPLVESVALVVPVPVVVDVVPVPEVLVDWSVAVEPVPKFELFVVAGVPVPEVVPCVPLVPCVAVFGPVPVALVPVLPEASEPLVCAFTPTAATRAAAAAAMVKLFGSLLIGVLLLQSESEVAVVCRLQRSASNGRRAKRLGRPPTGKPCAEDPRPAKGLPMRDTSAAMKSFSRRPARHAHPHPARPPLFDITWPLFSELLLGMLVGLAGLWLASRMSDTASGAFALANNVQATFFLLFRIVSVGVSVVITQNLGAGNREAADQTARASLGASTWLGVATAIGVAASAGPLLRLMNAPPAVLALGLPYLQILALALALDAFNASMSAVMRAHLHARDALLNMLAMHSLHLLLCWPLMNGIGPLPALGLPGFALAMVASRAFGLAFHLWLWKRRLKLVPTRADWWRIRGERLAPVLHIGLPGAAENVAYRLALMFTIALVAKMGAAELATHTYTMQLMYFILLSGLAVGFASEILVGHMVGARALHEAHQLVRRSLRWGLGISFTLALVAALTAPWTLRFFTADARVIETAQTLLWITVLLEPGRTFNLVVINALRATGDARFPVAAGVLSMVLVMAGGAWLLGVHWGWGLAGVWVAYTADEWLRGLMMAARWYRHGWVPHARETHRRVSAKRRELACKLPPDPTLAT